MARRVALQRRDLRLLGLLVERRAETLDFLHESFFNSRKRAQNRLRELELGGYLKRESVPLFDSSGLQSVYTLGPKGRAALELRSPAGDDFHGRRFNPTLRESSLPHQIATNRVADWIGAELLPEHLLPAANRDALRHRPDGVYEAARADSEGRSHVFLELDLGHYRRERVLGKLAAFLEHPSARSILFVSPTRERAAQIASWIRDAYGDGVMRRVQPLTFEEIRTGGALDPGTEPAGEALVRGWRRDRPG